MTWSTADSDTLQMQPFCTANKAISKSDCNVSYLAVCLPPLGSGASEGAVKPGAFLDVDDATIMGPVSPRHLWHVRPSYGWTLQGPGCDQLDAKLSRRQGFSPSQHVLGKLPRFPGSVTDDASVT